MSEMYLQKIPIRVVINEIFPRILFGDIVGPLSSTIKENFGYFKRDHTRHLFKIVYYFYTRGYWYFVYKIENNGTITTIEYMDRGSINS